MQQTAQRVGGLRSCISEGCSVRCSVAFGYARVFEDRREAPLWPGAIPGIAADDARKIFPVVELVGSATTVLRALARRGFANGALLVYEGGVARGTGRFNCGH